MSNQASPLDDQFAALAVPCLTNDEKAYLIHKLKTTPLEKQGSNEDGTNACHAIPRQLIKHMINSGEYGKEICEELILASAAEENLRIQDRAHNVGGEGDRDGSNHLSTENQLMRCIKEPEKYTLDEKDRQIMNRIFNAWDRLMRAGKASEKTFSAFLRHLQNVKLTTGESLIARMWSDTDQRTVCSSFKKAVLNHQHKDAPISTTTALKTLKAQPAKPPPAQPKAARAQSAKPLAQPASSISKSPPAPLNASHDQSGSPAQSASSSFIASMWSDTYQRSPSPPSMPFASPIVHWVSSVVSFSHDPVPYSFAASAPAPSPSLKFYRGGCFVPGGGRSPAGGSYHHPNR